jgi:hypothetical protein
MACTAFGARQNNKPSVSSWAEPILKSFVSGCWFLIWTDHTLYWVEKPIITVENGNFGRRLHCEDGPACANVIENYYFLHGVMVPAYVVVAPEMISLSEIKTESNEEVRRIMIERFGWEKYLRKTNAKIIDRRFNERDHQWEELFKLDDGTQRFLVSDPSTGRRYALGVSEVTTCEQAQRWMSFGLDSRAIHRS